MPKIRHRSTNKAQWSSKTLSKAEALMSQGHSMRSAAKAMNIPFSSLQKRLKKNNPSEPRLGRLPVFTSVVEKILSDRIKYLSSIFYGVTAIEIRKAAYQYAEELKISHNFDKSAKMAGRDWLDGFLKRNSISVRKPEATSINRITAFNKEEVQLFYRLLGDLMDKYKVLTQPEVIIQDTSIVIPSTSAPIDPIPPTSSATIYPMPCNSSVTTNLTPSTSSAEIHHMPSISSIAVDSIPSTSSATLAPGILNSNIEDLLPLPIKMVPEKPIRKGRMKQHAKIMTSTPEKDSLVEKENKKASRAAKGKNLMPKASKNQKPKKDIANKAKRRVLQNLNTSSESDISLSQICDDDEDDDLNKCLVCDEFGRNNELWYRCTSCGLWAHASCTGWDSPKGYVCDNC